jgi:hypothetical protein
MTGEVFSWQYFRGSIFMAVTAHRQSPSPRLLRKRDQKSGSFPPPTLPGFNGTMTLSDSRPDHRPNRRCRSTTSVQGGSPLFRDSLSRRAVPITPMDRSRCVRRLLPETVLPSRSLGRVGVHDFPFEACSGFTRITARRFARAPESALCRRASPGTVARPRRLPATGPTDHCPGGTLTHKVIAPSGTHPRTHKGHEGFNVVLLTQSVKRMNLCSSCDLRGLCVDKCQ